MSRVLITGGAGFIGCRLAASLLDRGHDVSVLDNLHPQVHPTQVIPSDLPSGARFLPGDVTASTSWAAILAASEPQVIVHLAAETGTGQSLTEPTRHAHVNVTGTAALIESIQRADVYPEQILLASSRAIYGDGAWQTDDGRTFSPGPRTTANLEAGIWDHTAADGTTARPLASTARETAPHPTNVYAATKLAQEHILSSWCQSHAVPLSILRLQNVYGPGQSVTNSYTGVLTFFARTALTGGVIDVYEDGEIVRDFVFVDDVVAAMCSAIDRPANRTLDIGSGTPTTIGAVASLVARLCEAPQPQVSGRYRHGDVRAASCTIDAARDDLGYSPAWTVEAGVAAVLDWMPTSPDFAVAS